ncbi:MAG TPA: hypothetical protein P5026_05460 [Kiritimatiellia bacterium]|nr:hypothetical protein [Kiritimatiellia bacterium]
MTGVGYWFYYVNYYGSNSSVALGAGGNDVGYFSNFGSNNWTTPGAEEGGTRWAHLRLTIDGGFVNPASPPRLYVSDGLTGYNPNTFRYQVSWFGGSASTVNGDILMLLWWTGTLVWVPGS